MEELSQEQISKLKLLDEDFALRLKSTLKIIDKETGQSIPFELNRVQKYLHEKLEDQRLRTGRVRAVILKGRKQGMSSYVAGRFFDAAMRENNSECFILAHREDTVNTLYDIVERFHESYPNYKIRGEEKNIISKEDIVEQNATRFAFANGSAYSVGTAGEGHIGRGFTIRRLHLSEAAFYRNGENISAGIMKAVPDAEGTEIIVESTASGTNNLFYNLAQKGKSGKGSFELIFIPWYWQEEYRRKLPENFYLTDEEISYKTLYNLDDEQMYWRRIEIEDSDGGIRQFKREYPATVDEAFEASLDNGLFNAEDILAARLTPLIQDKNRIIIGLDVAGSSQGDRTVFAFRKGANLTKLEVYKGWDTTAVVGRCVQIIREYNPIMIFIDVGYNRGVYDRLVELRYGGRVIGVNFGGGADDPTRFQNKRAEMYHRFAKWLADKPCSISLDKPLAEELQSEIMLTTVRPPDSHGRLLLLSKDQIKKDNNGYSPDLADAAALTFAYPVATYDDLTEQEQDEEEEEKQNRQIGRDKCSGY